MRLETTNQPMKRPPQPSPSRKSPFLIFLVAGVIAATVLGLAFVSNRSRSRRHYGRDMVREAVEVREESPAAIPRSSGQFMLRAQAAQQISDTQLRDQSFRRLALDAARYRQTSMVSHALVNIKDREFRDSTRHEIATELANRGQIDAALLHVNQLQANRSEALADLARNAIGRNDWARVTRIIQRVSDMGLRDQLYSYAAIRKAKTQSADSMDFSRRISNSRLRDETLSRIAKNDLSDFPRFTYSSGVKRKTSKSRTYVRTSPSKPSRPRRPVLETPAKTQPVTSKRAPAKPTVTRATVTQATGVKATAPKPASSPKKADGTKSAAKSSTSQKGAAKAEAATQSETTKTKQHVIHSEPGPTSAHGTKTSAPKTSGTKTSSPKAAGSKSLRKSGKK